MNFQKLKFSMIFLSLVTLGCSQNDNPQSSAQALGSEIQLKVNGLEKTSGQHYEGWALTANGVTSTGRFNIDEQGDIVAVNAQGQSLAVLGKDTATFALQSDSPNLTAFVLTIEPDGDNDPNPSSIHYLEGEFSNGKAKATLQESGAVGASFLNSDGTFILATPTNGPATHNQGIWYVSGGQPSLTLPELNASFTYEGWIVDTMTGEAVSTGVFDQANGADSDGPGAAAGPNPAPPFPGQDFINPAKILNDGHHMAVVSIEPVPDFDPAPFTLKILAQPISMNQAVTTDIMLNNISNEDDIFIEATVN